MAKKQPVSYGEKYPVVGSFKEQKELQKYYKKMTDTELSEWIAKYDLTYTPCPNSEPIDRMRKCMAILYYYFPKEPTKSKQSSPYAVYTLEDLVNMALENSVPVEMCADDKIMRMRIIMALRAHNILASK